MWLFNIALGNSKDPIKFIFYGKVKDSKGKK